MSLTLLLSLCLAAPAEGVRPLGVDGKPLNLDFETGTLEHWTANGDAFVKQPVQGDAVAERRKDMKSGHQGRFWIGSYEGHGDKPKGTLTSAAFTVTHPWATFLVGGGSGADTRIEILHEDKIIHKVHGADSETLERAAVDLVKHMGQLIQIRLVDEASGGWGHINFDDFLFHAEQPKDIRKQTSPQSIDEMKNAGLSPEKAAAAMTVPEGFSVSLFAGEPDVHQPVAFCFDDRGRLWVVEAFTYPKRNPHPGPLLPEKDRHLGDKVLIFEDTDGDGKFDKRTVFIEGLNLVSGIEYGFGGIYIGAAPYLLHIPIKDDKPAGELVILLDGWGYEDTHETLNSFVWGPDGWLYGCHGVFTYSKVGKPGTPKNQRTYIDAGVWRYHPTKHIFERYAEGTSNPWGLDYNQNGDFFVEACVIPHLFHIVQGGRYHRQAGLHNNPHTYIDIPTIADHRHYLGATPHGGNLKSDTAGGGHAHCGLMCYQGGAWPKEYHGQLFMGNIHGRRINMDVLHPKGSSYTASHGKDFLLANDAWARFIAMKYGPDGNMFVIDWYDAQACHRKEPEVWDRTNGRIYKVSYRGTKPVTSLDLQKCTDSELLKYQTHENEWYAAHARRILHERTETGKPTAEFIETLASQYRQSADRIERTRLLWTIQTLGTGTSLHHSDSTKNDASKAADSSPKLQGQLKYPANPVEWRHHLSMCIEKGIPLSDLEAYVCLHAVNNNSDVTLQCLAWYALEQYVAQNPALALKQVTEIDSPLLGLSLRRILTKGDPKAVEIVLQQLKPITKQPQQLIYLAELREAVKASGNTMVPESWNSVIVPLMESIEPPVRSAALAVAVAYRDSKAMNLLRNEVTDVKALPAERLSALQSLIDAKDAGLEPIFKTLLSDSVVRGLAIRAMGSLGGPAAPVTLLNAYPSFTTREKRDAVSTLASKPAFAMALLDAIDIKSIPAADVPAETIRLLRSFKDDKLNAKVIAVWGTFRDTPADRKNLIAEWRRKLTLTHDPDLAAGRAAFAKTCVQCHTLYGTGAAVGPDITGSNRADLAYLLENIFDPSAIITKEYAATTFDLSDGRKITGIVKAETPTQVTVATATESLKINVADIEKRKTADASMMPDDITKQLSEKDVKNLIAYLRHPQQVPMKATADNIKDLFNGKDLVGWDGEKEVWSVDNGEIVGKSTKGLKANQFLTSALEVSDFKLSLKVKLTPNKENSGIQFRSVRIPGTEMRGPQADIGKGWWGKLYEESGRGLLVKEGGEAHVKPDEWNDYMVEAKGPSVKITINGKLVADYTDEKLARKGLIGLQAHAGGPIEVRFKDLKLEVLP